ncbi:MAG TPA: hypothetical protein DEG71_04595 [Clostridiales bacterium]|nr:hypothetical protein [Clostridiales bacterium]
MYTLLVISLVIAHIVVFLVYKIKFWFSGFKFKLIYDKSIKINDKKHLSILEELRDKLAIKNRIFVGHKIKSREYNCKVNTYKGDIYIIFFGEFYDNVFSGILAHELAHIHFKHIDRRINYISNFFKRLNILLFITYIPLALWFWGKMSIKESWDLCGVWLNLIVMYIALKLFILPSLSPINRREEIEADILATQLVGKETYIRVLEFLNTKNKNKFIEVISYIFSFMLTHPPVNKRITAINNYFRI